MMGSRYPLSFSGGFVEYHLHLCCPFDNELPAGLATTVCGKPFVRVGNAYLSKTKKINRLIYFLDGNKKVNEGAFFYLFNNRYAELCRKMAAIEVLRCESQNEFLWKTVHNNVFETWFMLQSQFDVCAFGIDGVKEVIGEADKSKRVCRFCREPDKKYAHTAHAIPEAIGNKLLKCAEECDGCNEELREVEDNFIHLMDFRRAMYMVAGKERTECPKIKGRDYTIAPDEDGMPSLYIKESNSPIKIYRDGVAWYKFNHSTPVVDQDIYRALVKMVIDLAPAERLSHFQRTIDWVTKKDNDVIIDSLPSVLFGALPEGNMFKQPIMYLFFRKGVDPTVPYCTAMLFTTDIAYQFVVPYVDVDNRMFIFDEQLNASREQLNRYFRIKWECQQYYSWWQSNIWNYWPIDRRDSNIYICPDNDPIFLANKIYTNEELRLMDANIFTAKDIAHTVMDMPLIEMYRSSNRLKSLAISRPDNEHELAVELALHFEENRCVMRISLPVRINGADDVLTATLTADVARLDRINRHDKYITGETFSSLAMIMWHKAARLVDRKLSLLMRRRDLSLLRNIPGLKIVRHSKFDFFFPGGARIRSDYRALVE